MYGELKERISMPGRQRELMSIFTIPAGISFKTQIMELHELQFVVIADGS